MIGNELTLCMMRLTEPTTTAPFASQFNLETIGQQLLMQSSAVDVKLVKRPKGILCWARIGARRTSSNLDKVNW
jgi:hypothetical protein